MKYLLGLALTFILLTRVALVPTIEQLLETHLERAGFTDVHYKIFTVPTKIVGFVYGLYTGNEYVFVFGFDPSVETLPVDVKEFIVAHEVGHILPVCIHAGSIQRIFAEYCADSHAVGATDNYEAAIRFFHLFPDANAQRRLEYLNKGHESSN